MADVVIHDMIEQIYFYLIIFSQKEMGSKKHKSDVVLPGPHINKLRIYQLVTTEILAIISKLPIYICCVLFLRGLLSLCFLEHSLTSHQITIRFLLWLVQQLPVLTQLLCGLWVF